MQLGPVALMRASNKKTLLAQLDDCKTTLARLGNYLRAGFMHFPLDAKTAPPVVLNPDQTSEQSREAVLRVTEAYHRAMADFVSPAPSLWNEIEKRTEEQAFRSALLQRDFPTIQNRLSRMFQTDLLWGLGKVDKSHVNEMQDNPNDSHYQLRCIDALVSLGEAVAASRVVLVAQQGVQAYYEALNVDPHSLLQEIEEKTGMDFSFPSVGAAYGCRISGKLVTIDSLLHGHTVYRLLQLGVEANSKIVEIGGGYGCLAALCHRENLGNYEIFDLPWVNAIQGYFLLMALPPGSVSLYGETQGNVKVTPHWFFADVPDNSVDFVINTNSLPEIGRESAKEYVSQIKRALRGKFLSINQEGKLNIPGVGPQNCVAELIAEAGGFQTLSRNLWWMNQGYVEEVFSLKASA